MQGIDNLNTERAEKLHDYTNGYYPEWIEDHEFQPVYAKLGKMITDRIPYKLGVHGLSEERRQAEADPALCGETGDSDQEEGESGEGSGKKGVMI